MEFRLKDVIEQYKIYCMLLIFFTGVHIFKFLLQPDVITMVDAFYVLSAPIPHIIYYQLRHRLPSKHIQTGLIVIHIVTNVMVIPVYLFAIAPSDSSETEKKVYLEFKLKESINAAGYLTAFLCSSLRFYFLTMIPILGVFAAITMLHQKEKIFGELMS